MKPGTTSVSPAAFYDVLPTLAEIAGAPTPANLDARSFAPTLFGKEQKPHDYLYWEFPEKLGQQAVRLGDWKGVRLNVKKAPEGPIELYDLKSDVAESKNVAAAHPEIIARMAEIMRSGRTESVEFPLRAGQPPAATARANPLIGRWKILSMGKKKLPDNVQLFWTFDAHNVVVTDDNGDVLTKSQYSLRNDREHNVISLS